MTLDSGTLRTWYEQETRGYIADLSPERVDAIDAAIGKLGVQETTELTVCFLGSAGVGKSTLLNAIVAGDRTLVPQGGVGPLTAQATLVRYSSERGFRATYLKKNLLNNILFALERDHERELAKAGRGVEAAELFELSEEEQLELEATLATPEAEEAARDGEMNPREKIDSYAARARLLVLGDQYVDADRDLPYVMDGLRDCLGMPRRWGTTLHDGDEGRIARVRHALEIGEHEQRGDGPIDTIREEIALHASGFLSPVIRTLEVWWDAEALREGLVLVDLPGVGVANDEYRRVTADWIRRARAVVLVVDRAGVTEAAAELLRTTGYLNSLLHEGDDPTAEPPVLLVAAAKLDEVARSDWAGEREKLGPERARKWIEHFDHVCSKMTEVVRGQVQSELEKIVDAGPEATRDARVEVVRNVLATLQIHPLSASEYRKLLRDDEEDRARVRAPEESRIPSFTNALKTLAHQRVAAAKTRSEQRLQDAHERVRATLEVVLEQWRAEDRAEAEVLRLRAELEEVAKPLYRELDIRQGAFREFLRESMPREIQARTLAASNDAEKDIRRYLRKYEKYHWATLRAAIRKGGFFNGSRQVDLPNELTLRFEEPLTVLWSKELLVELRKRTRALGDDCVRLVEQVLDWARGQGARVRPQLVESLRDDLKAQSRELSSVGKEAIDELKDRVKTELFQHVEKEIQRRCQKFVDSKRGVGTGTKRNILEFLHEELAEAVVAAARPAAERVLAANYRQVEREITEAFAQVKNPIESSIEAIASAHGDTVRRSDAQRRRHVIAEGERLLSTLPTGGA